MPSHRQTSYSITEYFPTDFIGPILSCYYSSISSWLCPSISKRNFYNSVTDVTKAKKINAIQKAKNKQTNKQNIKDILKIHIFWSMNFFQSKN